MRRADSEINQQDDRVNRDAVADDRERPGVAGIPLVHQTAHRTLVEVMRPAGKDRTLTAMRAALRSAAADCRQDAIHTYNELVSEISKTSVALTGTLLLGGLLPYASSGGTITRR